MDAMRYAGEVARLDLVTGDPPDGVRCVGCDAPELFLRDALGSWVCTHCGHHWYPKDEEQWAARHV